MKPQQAPAGMRCHLVRTDGEIVGDGDAVAYAQPHQTVEWYASYAERETLPEVDAWRRVMVSIDRESRASASGRDWNVTLEYANKRLEAQMWLTDHPVEDNATLPAAPSAYEHLRAEVEVMGITPFQAASAIMGAVYESAQATRRRVESREQARAMRPATP